FRGRRGLRWWRGRQKALRRSNPNPFAAGFFIREKPMRNRFIYDRDLGGIFSVLSSEVASTYQLDAGSPEIVRTNQHEFNIGNFRQRSGEGTAFNAEVLAPTATKSKR